MVPNSGVSTAAPGVLENQEAQPPRKAPEVLPDPSRRAKGHRLIPNLLVPCTAFSPRAGRGGEKEGRKGTFPSSVLRILERHRNDHSPACPPQGRVDRGRLAETDRGFYTQKTDSEPQTHRCTCVHTLTHRERESGFPQGKEDVRLGKVRALSPLTPVLMIKFSFSDQKPTWG